MSWASNHPANGRLWRLDQRSARNQSDLTAPRGGDFDEAARGQQTIKLPLRRERLILPPLPPLPTAARRARRFTTEMLALWAMSDLTEDATLIVSELVTNAVQHAGSDLKLRLEHGHDLLHMAVCDRDSPARVPQKTIAADRPGTGGPIREDGRGLHIVRTLATASGRTSAPAGCSVYWATLRTGERAGRQ